MSVSTKPAALPIAASLVPPAPPVAVADAPKPRAIQALTVPRLRLISSSERDSGNRFRATAPSITLPADPEHDEFWSSNADKLQVGDIIEVVPDDAAWFLEVYVVEADSPARGVPNKRVSVANIRFVDMKASRRVPQADEYKVESRGDFLKWCVVHIPTDRAVIEKCYDRGEANEKLRAFLRVRDDKKKIA